MKELPDSGITYLTQIFNAVLRLKAFPSQWKVAQVIMIPKPDKTPEDPKSYRPIIIKEVIKEKNLIPNHQFGFRQSHSTIEQMHRLVSEIHKSMENKEFCSAAFMDVSQAFDKVWHDGLLYKIKTNLPDFY